MHILSNKSIIRFGDVEPKTAIFYIDPHTHNIGPCFVIDINPIPKKPSLQEMVLLLVPEHLRSKPLAEFDSKSLRQIRFVCKKMDTQVLVNTNPPTVYSTTEEELRLWQKFS